MALPAGTSRLVKCRKTLIANDPFFLRGECGRERKEGFTHWHITAGMAAKKIIFAEHSFFCVGEGGRRGRRALPAENPGEA